MISKSALDKQLSDIGAKIGFWGRPELAELSNVLTPNERISQVVVGYYENGFALLVSTDYRMLLIDKKPFNFLNVEDFRFDMINQLDYNHRLLKSSINVSAGPKNLRFISYNQKDLRQLLNCVQCRMIEIKEEKKYAAELQHSKLDKLDQTLKQYIQAQLSQLSNKVKPVAASSEPTEDSSGLTSRVALESYLQQVDNTSSTYIKTGSLLPRQLDLTAAKIAFAKLPWVISRRRRQGTS